MDEILSIIIKVVGTACGTAIATAVSVVATKMVNKLKESSVIAYAVELVKAAEQLYPNEGVKTGTEKYQYVLEQLMVKFPKITDNTYLQTLIESAVYTVNNQLEENTDETVTQVTANMGKSVDNTTDTTGLSSF